MMKNALSAVALSCAAALPVVAEDAFDLPVSGAILTGWEQADGSRVAALHIKLAPGWKTYWRSPGDAGIPPRFDWSGSDNLASAQINWPAPSVFLTAGMRTIGYEGDLVLPVVLAPDRAGNPIKLEANLDIGVCREICIPHQMSLSAVIDDNNTKPTPAIAAALAARPYSQKEAGVSQVDCTLRPISDGMAIEATISLPSTGGSEVVIIEPGQPGVWMSETETTRTGAQLVAVGEMVPGDAQPFVIDRSNVRITVLGQNHAVDIQGC